MPPNTPSNSKISIIVPIYNEAENIPLFYEALQNTMRPVSYSFELIFVNDGSTDMSDRCIERLAQTDPSVRYLEFSRNFGKEVATTAGLHAAAGDAAILIDADLQHPVHLIPAFINEWKNGAEVVVGVRNKTKSDTMIKRVGSRAFYSLMQRISDTNITPRATDYRLLDRAVVNEFNRLTEKSRLTRGLIDWLGFNRSYIYFDANDRVHGTASYGTMKLVGLAVAGITAHSILPLRIAGYLGALITLTSLVVGPIMLFDALFVQQLNFSGPAMLAVLILFLVGIVLICLGLLAFYIGNIFRETQNRPMYVIKRKIN